MERQNEKVKEWSGRNTVIMKAAGKEGIDYVAAGGPCQPAVQGEESELVIALSWGSDTVCKGGAFCRGLSTGSFLLLLCQSCSAAQTVVLPCPRFPQSAASHCLGHKQFLSVQAVAE